MNGMSVNYRIWLDGTITVEAFYPGIGWCPVPQDQVHDVLEDAIAQGKRISTYTEQTA